MDDINKGMNSLGHKQRYEQFKTTDCYSNKARALRQLQILTLVS